ncbi:MAG TPA: hypothetical protein PLL66_08315 [Bacteroidales bacterium]|nr:hypothetical protein [Bacteroidales bacterium]
MKTTFLTVFLFSCIVVFAQEIKIETVYFDTERYEENVSHIPYVIDVSGKNEDAVLEINQSILDFFMLESFIPSEAEDFGWWSMRYTFEIKSDYLLISITGEYRGPHIEPVFAELYFDLKSGVLVNDKTMKYNSLFALDSFFDFMNKFCLPNCEKAVLEAQDCAELEAIYCDCYDLEFLVNDNSVDFVLTGDCMPHYAQACDPGGYIMNVKTDSLKPYLNDFGRYLIFESGYQNFTQLEKQLFGMEKSADIPPYYFIQGRIDGRYQFSMGLELSKAENIARGYYFYHSQKKHISLTGAYEDSRIKLTETVNNKVTGIFYFYFFNEYSEGCCHLADGMYLSAVWVNTKTNEEFVVNLDKVLFNK